MRIYMRLFGAVLGLAIASPWGVSYAQDGKPAFGGKTGGGMPAAVRLGKTFGPSGLLGELSQSEFYGAVQSRQAQSRAGIAAANADGIFTGYQDSDTKLTTPATLLLSLPDGDSVVKLKATGAFSRADKNQTFADSNQGTALVEYLTMLSNKTLIGFGVTRNVLHVDIQHNGGSINGGNFGFQGDMLHKFSDRWGIAARALYLWLDNKTTIPVGPGQLVTDQGSNRFYTEAALVGNYGPDELSWIPMGWELFPKIRGIYQNTTFETVTNSFGGINNGTIGPSDSYVTAGASLRLQKNAFVPMEIGPYIELGYSREIINDLNLVVDDPNILNSKVGFAVTLPNRGRFEASYARDDGFKGDRNQQRVTLIYSHSF